MSISRRSLERTAFKTRQELYTACTYLKTIIQGLSPLQMCVCMCLSLSIVLSVYMSVCFSRMKIMRNLLTRMFQSQDFDHVMFTPGVDLLGWWY